MNLPTLLIVLLVLFVLFGGGWYGLGHGLSPLMLVVIVLVIIVLFGGGGYWYRGRRGGE